MRLGIIVFLLGNISFLYYLPFDRSKMDTIVYQLCMHWVLISIGFFACIGVLYKSYFFFVSLEAIFYKKIYQSLIIIISFLSGYCFTAIYTTQFYPILNLNGLESQSLTVKGRVVSIPNNINKKQSLLFFITARKRIDNEAKEYWDTSFQGKVKLNWYRTKEIMLINQTWQLVIRLKKPSGLLNGGFDYEKWLYQKRILATGYIREGVKISITDTTFTPHLFFMKTIHQWRQLIADQIDHSLSDYRYKGLIKALTIGVRADIDTTQWQQFMKTGTNHLIAISGLHISLMSGLIWILVNYLWRSCSFLNLMYPALYVASLCALLTAIIYASLAGFALPAQRALMMLTVVFIATMLKREFLSSYIFLIALLSVILFDPLSTLSAGFWLSFSAVGIIFFTLSLRLSYKNSRMEKFWQLIKLQSVIFIGLLAPLMILFQQFSIISPVANIIAVPLMSVIVVPLSLLGLLILLLYEPLGILIFNALAWPIDALFWFLDQLIKGSVSVIYLPQPTLIAGILLIIGCIWLLLPKGWSGRWLGLLLLFPTLATETDHIPQGQIKMTMFDVGQGLSMLISTQNHHLLYDVGEKYSESFNMADVVIIPYLKRHNIKALDTLIISHSDRDHAGSFQELVQQVTVHQVLSGEPDPLIARLNMQSPSKIISIEQCQQGQQWQWDGVIFTVLSPKNKTTKIKNNNQSCVIHIRSATNHTYLLTGDIEKPIEKQLLIDYPKLKADVLQVPHHGSKTSSSNVFLQQLDPQIALFSFGYKNRFRHPAEKIVQNYKNLSINCYNTNNGSITVDYNDINHSLSVIEYRADKTMLWHRAIHSL